MFRKLFAAAALVALTATLLLVHRRKACRLKMAVLRLRPKQRLRKGFFENLSQYFGATFGNNSGTSNAVDRTISAIAVDLNA